MNNKAIEILRQHTREFPITGKLLAKKIGLPQRKSGLEGADLRALIHELRVAGFPICASTSGYYFAQNKAELDNFIGRLENRIGKQQEVVDTLKKIKMAEKPPKIFKPTTKETVQKFLL